MAGLDAQRLAFGTVADAYDRHRPGYAAEVLDRLLDAAGIRAGARVLEIGAGTGKLTASLSQRGLVVLAVEPSAEMAARLSARRLPGVETVVSDFETVAPPREPVELVASAAAWHWLDPARRCRLARAWLREGVTLAGVWTFPDWSRVGPRERLADAYRRCAPALAADFPMHPDSEPTALAGDWVDEMRRSGAFGGARVEVLRGSLELDAEGYTGLLRTHQDHILLDDATRERLLEALGEVVDAAGGHLSLATQTWVCLASAV